ncbi:MAG: type I glyceraldehyde-3-phosphate dehydrogenase [Candidatus Manganitrophus sp.]|nr:type I glyceraldehyde-3-phosphate dehydrogenase [Candidatus Manganitrophus sp.]
MRNDLEVVAVNDIADPESLAYAFKYDSVHGKWKHPFEVEKNHFVADGKKIAVLNEADPSRLPWKEWDVEGVIESSGKFTNREGALKHLQAGARKVLVSAPARDADLTVTMGVNEDRYDPQHHHIVSNASCTTNCIAPVAKVLNDAFTIEHALMNTVHAYTASQALLDRPKKKDKRRGRAAALSLIPTTTGAAVAATQALPELAGKINGMAIRAPIPDVSILDLVAQTREPVDVEKIIGAFQKAEQNPRLAPILQVSEEELVSIDYVGSPYSAVIDAPSTMVVGEHLLRVLAWYDNEWGFSNRLVDVTKLL